MATVAAYARHNIRVQIMMMMAMMMIMMMMMRRRRRRRRVMMMMMIMMMMMVMMMMILCSAPSQIVSCHGQTHGCRPASAPPKYA